MPRTRTSTPKDSAPLYAFGPGALVPRPTHTHRITIPGTRFLAHVRGEEAALKLAKRLAKTRIAPRKLAKPIIEELAALG